MGTIEDLEVAGDEPRPSGVNDAPEAGARTRSWTHETGVVRASPATELRATSGWSINI